MQTISKLEQQIAPNSSTLVEKTQSEIPINLTPSAFAAAADNLSLKIIPCKDKVPQVKNWQKGEIDNNDVLTHWENGSATSIGVLTGKVSNNLIGIDFDGIDTQLEESWMPMLTPTIGVTSGKTGHFTCFYRASEEQVKIIDTMPRKISLGKKSVSNNNKEAHIDIRWNGHQCIVYGAHPEMDSYKIWGDKYFDNSDIEQLPDALLQRLLRESKDREDRTTNKRKTLKTPKKAVKPKESPKSSELIGFKIEREDFSKEDANHLQKIVTCLNLLSEDDCDDQDSWFEITAGLKYEALEHPEIEDEIEKIWNLWSSKSDNYNQQENLARWNSLNDTSDNAITLGTIINEYCGGWNLVQQKMIELFPELDPYLVDSTKSGTFESCLARILESQDYISLDSNCYQWMGTHWTFVSDDKMMTQIARESEKFYRLKKGIKTYSFATDNNLKSGLNFFKSFHNRSDISISNKHLIAFNNGTLDVRTNVLSLGHDKTDYLTFKIVGDYVKDAELPEVAQNFFVSAFGEELIPYVRAVYRMYLDSTFPYSKFVHVIGASGSGKGTFIRLLLSMLNQTSIGSGNDLTCFNKPDKIMQELAGKSIYALPDMNNYTKNCTGFYELVDNGILSGRVLYASHTITKRWNVRFIIGSVDPIKVGSSNDGWSRRVLQLPTKRRESKADLQLEEKLRNVSAQIASWALQMPKEEALDLIQNAGANEIISESTLEAAIFGDSVKQFLDQCVKLTGRCNNHIALSELHKYYKIFCQEKGYKPVAQNSFCSTIKSELNHLHLKKTTIKGKPRPSSLGYVKIAPGLFPEVGGYNKSIEYRSEYEVEGNFKNLLRFDPEKVNSDPDYAEIETAIWLCDEHALKKSSIAVMRRRKIYDSIDESKLNEAQQKLLKKAKKSY